MFRRSIESWIMVALAGHVIETRYLKDLSTGPSSDLARSDATAIWYVRSGRWARRSSSCRSVPTSCRRSRSSSPPNELLDQLYAETERLVLQKMTAVDYVARALIERDELIGEELEEVFLEAEEVDPDADPAV